MTKIDIVSGFLGAGKTTLIKKLLAEAFPGEKLVLIENEFGEISIDGGFLKESGVQISEMSAGCICCSLVGDFHKALKDVQAQFHPDRILIEPSGVGKLSDVIVAVQNTADETDDMKLNSFVTVADATKVKVYMKNFGEFYNNQIEAAGTIILSRTQKMSQEKLEAAVAMLREKNADAAILTTPWDQLDGKTILAAIEKVSLADELLGKMRAEHAADEAEHEHAHHHHDHEHAHEEHEHHHDHDHHHHDHGHGHHHAHVHRNIHDVFAVIDRLENEHVKTLAKKMFMIVAEAESKAHGLPIEEVHFHEVGAIDSIVDIISVAVCVDNLGVDDIVVSELYEGSGHVHCQHGMMPVPVPATANIVTANHLPMKITDAQGEMVTPTGAAIAAALRTQDHLPEDYQLLKIGLGAGKKDFPKANVLRAMLLETKDQPQTGEEEDIWKLESNIDDCSGEVLGYTMERLLAAGARDVCYAPIYMKKNRPAYMLHVLCDRRQIPAMEEIIFNETTTIGIRRYKVERTILKRHEAKAKTAYGEVKLKICEKNGIVYRYPEYESVKKLCEAAGVPFKVVYQAACEAEISE